MLAKSDKNNTKSFIYCAMLQVRDNIFVTMSQLLCRNCVYPLQVFKELGQEYGLVELDEVEDGSSMQEYLSQLTGARSVRLIYPLGIPLL